LRNNEYDIKATNKFPPTPRKKETHVISQDQKIKWATLTYSGKEERKVTNLFPDTNIKVEFRTWNQIKDILRPRPAGVVMTPSSMRVVELRLSLMGAHPDQGLRWGTA
jgi:hypothetical protein